MFIQDCLGVNSYGHLTIGGVDTIQIAKEFGTPAYVLDEDRIRFLCRLYKNSLNKHFGEGSEPIYSVKALCFKKIFNIMSEEGLGVNVASPGELFTAHSAGFPMKKVYYHGNNKSSSDLKMALSYNIGCFVVDSYEELERLNRYSGQLLRKQKVLIRITPGVAGNSNIAADTGKVGSKFGFAIKTGQAMEIVREALGMTNINLAGFHCNIGTQIFDSAPYKECAEIMLNFIKDVKDETGYVTRTLNLGGGFGVRYTFDQPETDYDKIIGEIAEKIKADCNDKGLEIPKIQLEPGRSLTADAGITLYKVGAVKEITGYRTYVSVNGGMCDNPRYALYQSKYDAVIANYPNNEKTLKCTIAGRCCESGDLISEDINIQQTKRGDILAVFVTGAYNYSMSSNYNRVPRPPVILVKDGKVREAVKRESLEDLIRNDI